MATEKILIEIQTKLDETNDQLKKTNEELAEMKKSQEDINENAKKASKGIDGMASAFKGVGTAIKAMGIGLVLKAFDLFSEILMENQIAVDAFSNAFETASIMVSDFINWVTESAGGVTEKFTAIFNDPLGAVEDLGNAIKDNIMERIQSFIDMLGHLGTAIKAVFEGDWDKAMESAKEAGKEYIDTLTGVDDSLNKMVETGKEVVESIGEYASETYNAAKAQTALNKEAELAEIRNQGLIEQYDRQAEKLRQIRDDETQTMEVRMKANEDLGALLEEQEKAMLSNAEIRLEQANRKLALDESNHEAQKEQLEALNELAAIEAQIEGFRSEQISNRISLEREAADIEQEILDEKLEKQSNFYASITEKMEAAVEAEQKKREEAKALEEAVNESRTEAVGMMFSAMGQFAEDNAALQKGIAIAETIWNTAQGIMKTVASLGMPAAIPFSIAAATMGAAQIASILKTDPDNSSGGGSVAAVPSAPALNTSVNALQTSPNAQISGLGSTEPQRAFVVSTDVTTQQSLDRRIVSNATFG